jgi:hypothetical protein
MTLHVLFVNAFHIPQSKIGIPTAPKALMFLASTNQVALWPTRCCAPNLQHVSSSFAVMKNMFLHLLVTNPRQKTGILSLYPK